MKGLFYILDEHGKPRPTTPLEWGVWFDKADRRICRTTITDGVYVSTVFSGFNLDPCLSDDPLLWETMVFGGKMDLNRDQCSGSREQAEAMHNKMCQEVREAEMKE